MSTTTTPAPKVYVYTVGATTYAVCYCWACKAAGSGAAYADSLDPQPRKSTRAAVLAQHAAAVTA